MIIGIVSDTHEDRANALPLVMSEFARRKVDMIIHAGDISRRHLDPGLFLGQIGRAHV